MHSNRIRHAGIVFVYFGCVLGLITLALAGIAGHVDVWNLMRDPSATTDTPPWRGLISNLGVLIWCATATVCLFAAALLWSAGSDGRSMRLLFWAGVLTLILLIDDFFLLHEDLLLRLGLGETMIYGMYGLAIVSFLLVFHQTFLRLEALPLWISLACFAAAVGFDVLSLDQSSWLDYGTRTRITLALVIEDGLKLLGIVGWAHYFGKISYARGLAGTQV